MSGGHRKIFEDASGLRWRRTLWVAGSAAAAVFLLLAVLVWGAVASPALAPLRLANRAPLLTAIDAPATRREPRRRHIQPAADHAKVALRYGFLVDWDDNSFVSLRRNANNLDVLVPEWLRLTADGIAQSENSAKEARDRAWLRANAPQLQLMPLVINFDEATQSWAGAAVGRFLADPAWRARTIATLADYARRNNDAGINLDFEQIPAGSRTDYVAFVEALSQRLHAIGKRLDLCAPADDDSFAYAAIARAVDHMVIMAYDEHAVDSTPGPIASLGWYERVLDKRFADLPSDKLIAAFGSYGYDWPVGAHGSEVTVQEAWQAAADAGVTPKFDPDALDAGFAYVDGEQRHTVWFLDAASAYNLVDAALAMHPAGVALWRLGTEDPGVWAFLARGHAPNAQAQKAMQTMHAGYDLIYDGQGEVLRVTGHEKPGARSFELSPSDNLIVGEKISRLPLGETISRWGYRTDHVVALTFDDGPDPRWTPQVLDILKREHAPATFFVIGENAEANPGLLRRIWREGHDIGSHTFTHPNLGATPPALAEVELNMTERLLQSELKVSPLLFRPPYAEDVEPETIDDARILDSSTRLGYTTLGLRLDPADWRRPGVDAIVSATLNQAEAGIGNVILLHDSGGDRSQTIAALPRIIETLRAHGFRLVSTHELLNVSREQIAPKLSPDQWAIASAERIAFDMVNGFNSAMSALFVAGLALGLLRFGVLASFAAIQGWQSHRRRPSATTPSMTVIVPAYNEEKVVVSTIRSLLASEGVDCEIIVVDDGSKDSTAQVVRDAFHDEGRVSLISQRNGGKASAINTGIAHSRAEIVVVIDADTVIDAKALAHLARAFGDERVGAVAGNAKVGNPVSLLAKFQAVEYITSQNLDRRAYDALNAIAVVPGAIGAWRRTALVAVGGFASDTLAEDADATMKLLRAGYRVIYEPRAIAYTEAPETLGAFVRQRQRWMFGTLQAVFKHRGAIVERRPNALGWFVLPNVAIFQVLFPLISPVMDALLLWSVIWGAVSMFMHPAEGPPSGLILAAVFYLAFQFGELLTAAIAFALEPKPPWKWLPLVVAQRFCYRQILYWIAIRSFLRALRGREEGWGKLERTGAVLGA